MIILVAILAYIIGSIPAAYIIGKTFFDTDIRTLGSGNVGTTNALRNFGPKAGLATLLFDVFKGALATFIGGKIAGVDGMAVAQFMVVIGHMYSIFLGFKSGKGMATTVGGILSIDFMYGATLAVLFFILVGLTKIVSLASLITTVVILVSGYFVFGPSSIYLSLAIVSLLIIYKHRSNIDRLIKGEESKISLR